MELKYIVKNTTYENINQIMTSHFKISTRLKNKLIKKNRIYLNSKITDTRNNVKIGDKIIIDFNYEENNSNIVPKKMNLEIIYEDEWLIAINKPAGIAIHPSILNYYNSL